MTVCITGQAVLVVRCQAGKDGLISRCNTENGQDAACLADLEATRLTCVATGQPSIPACMSEAVLRSWSASETGSIRDLLDPEEGFVRSPLSFSTSLNWRRTSRSPGWLSCQPVPLMGLTMVSISSTMLATMTGVSGGTYS